MKDYYKIFTTSNLRVFSRFFFYKYRKLDNANKFANSNAAKYWPSKIRKF